MQILEYLESRVGMKSLFIAQGVCVVFFIFDVIREFTGIPEKIGFFNFEIFEFLVVFVMVISMVMTGRQLVKSRETSDQLHGKLRAASGEFHEMLEQCFKDWKLTSSECDVALLAVKGLGISEISSLRETKEGTIKAQLNSIYKKAGVTGRPQLISFFVEELMTGDFAGKLKAASD